MTLAFNRFVLCTYFMAFRFGVLLLCVLPTYPFSCFASTTTHPPPAVLKGFVDKVSAFFSWVCFWPPSVILGEILSQTDRQTSEQSAERPGLAMWSTGIEVDTCSHGAEVCGCVSVCVWKQSDWWRVGKGWGWGGGPSCHTINSLFPRSTPNVPVVGLLTAHWETSWLLLSKRSKVTGCS